jgi:invasion protein IalB
MGTRDAMNATPFASLLLAASLALAAGAARAQTPQVEPLGEFGSWAAASFQEEKGKGCFMVGAPRKSEGKYTKRDPTYIHVTHRLGVGTRDVVNVTAGYTYKPDSKVEITVGGETFVLKPAEGTAWADDEIDAKLIAAMRKSKTAVVEGTSSRGTLTKDTYGLNGFSDAYDAINKACPPPQ